MTTDRLEIVRARLRLPALVYERYGGMAITTALTGATSRPGVLMSLGSGIVACSWVEYAMHRWGVVPTLWDRLLDAYPPPRSERRA